jgi:8-oxo-dGTP diphosphatase
VPPIKQVEVVGAVIINPQNEILCALRAQNMTLGGMWEFPGGKIEPGETHQEALVREIREELGCDITVGMFVAECVHEYPNVVVHLITYYAFISSGAPSAREHERLEWLPVEEISGLNWAPADIPTVHQLIQGSTA